MVAPHCAKLRTTPDARRSLDNQDLSGYVSASMNARTETDWRCWLFEFVDDFRRTRQPELLSPSTRGLSPDLQALFAAVVESLAIEANLPIPNWCNRVPPLPQPWFVAGVENLKASALVESPLPFRRRNIFVLENFLARL
jgi:hypothetical protein